MEFEPVLPFFNIYRHGFIRAAAAAPRVRPADPTFNVERTIEMMSRAHEQQAAILLFPELGVSGYAIDDLLHQDALLEGVAQGIADLVAASRKLLPVVAVGAPLVSEGRLYNAAIIIHRGRILAAIPKVFLPNYREFYERRHFASGAGVQGQTISLAGQEVPFGTDILIKADDLPDLVMHAEICEDVWTPIPPSSYAAMAGASVLLNLSASNATVGKSDYRHALCRVHSARCLAAYLFSAAGPGESTTDLAWDGQAVIYEMGTKLADAPRFHRDPQIIFADVDLERIRQERLRQNTFGDCADVHAADQKFRTVSFELGAPLKTRIDLDRSVSRFPYVPDDEARLSELCFEAYNIQSHGLRKRLEASGLQKIVIGVSGGLDSTHAVLVAAHTFDELGLPRKNILAYSLPGFATSTHTRSNALQLMDALGVSAEEIDITPQCEQMLADIHHPYAKGEKRYDVTFENVQAGARTSILFRLANQHDALVLGTGDLSELALGWCTYGVGDHMSHYNVNASVPKTLIQHLIRWVIAENMFGAKVAETLHAILNTEISPELIPGDSKDGPSQSTEAIVGPYELQDFNLYYITRYGFRPSRVAFLAANAWGDKERGNWPPNIAADRRNAYTLSDIKHWLGVFLRRFFQTSQFKRSALPNGPKVSSGGSLSPRGDWRAPSDSNAAVWLAELAENVPDSADEQAEAAALSKAD